MLRRMLSCEMTRLPSWLEDPAVDETGELVLVDSERDGDGRAR